MSVVKVAKNIETTEKEEKVIEALGQAIKNGGKVNAQDRYGGTALYWAAFYNKPKIVEFLLEKGANVSIANQTGLTPLHVAAFNLLPREAIGGRAPNHDPEKAEPIVRALLAKGADLTVVDRDGMTPLAIAERYDRKGVLRKIRNEPAMEVARVSVAKGVPEDVSRKIRGLVGTFGGRKTRARKIKRRKTLRRKGKMY